VTQRDDFDAGDLAALYERTAERELKEQIVFGLSQRDEPEAVDQLIQIARTETDTDLRKKAVFWLGQSDDPRVAEFLMQIISQEPSQ
jgi:HEAT repeat protein